MNFNEAKNWYKDAKKFYEGSKAVSNDEEEKYVVQKSYYVDAKKEYEDVKHFMDIYIRNNTPIKLIEDMLEMQDGDIELFRDCLNYAYQKAFSISKDENDKFLNELEALKDDENISLLIKDDLKSKLFVDAFINRRELEKNGLFKVREIDISDTSLISHISEEEISNSASLFKNNGEEKKR